MFSPKFSFYGYYLRSIKKSCVQNTWRHRSSVKLSLNSNIGSKLLERKIMETDIQMQINWH